MKFITIKESLTVHKKIFYFLLTAFIFLFFLCYYKILIGTKTFTHDTINWSAPFYYYVNGLTNGYIPYWDPYLLSGTHFYPNIHLLGLLDPLILPFALLKFWGMHILRAYTFFYISRLIVFALGGYFLFKEITNCKISSLLSSGILLFSMGSVAFRQNGPINVSFLTPFALYFLILFLNNLDKNPHKYLYFSCVIFITGITLNVFIPAYYLFNFLVFFIVIMSLKITSFEKFLKIFHDKNFILFTITALLLVILMVAPSLAVFKDSSNNGELFPSLRLHAKFGDTYKKIIASELKESSLSNKFTGELGVYASYGNMINLIYPGISVEYFCNKGVFKSKDFLAETFQYIGIIPFLISIAGFMYSKSRYRYLALIMLIIISLNMLNLHGAHAKPANFIQTIFNQIFPPLKMIEVRSIFSSFFLLYLCMLLALGFEVFLNKGKEINEKKIYLIGILIITSKILLSILLYFQPQHLYIKHQEIDIYAYFAILSFLVIYKFLYKQKTKVFNSIVFALIFFDLLLYNIHLNKNTIQCNELKKELDIEPRKKFDFFRTPLFLKDERVFKSLAFSESITQSKKVFALATDNNTFTIRRYYDFLTHVPLRNQFLLEGIIYPILKFYPEKNVAWKDKHSILSILGKSNFEYLFDFNNSILYLEKLNFENKEKNKTYDFKKAENVSYLDSNYIKKTYTDFMEDNYYKLKGIKKNINKYLKNDDSSIRVNSFSEIFLKVRIDNKKDGYLFYNDNWSKYWKAYDNGVEIPVYIANYTSKAVFLKKGTHEVSFVFDPVYYRIGLWCYYIGLAISFSFIIFFYLKMPKNKIS